MTVQRHLADQLCDPGSDRALCSAPLSPPVLGGGDDDDSDWVARVLSSFGDGSIVASTLRWSGGGKEVCGIPGRGEEDKYRYQKVQVGVDKAQHGQEEEEGESIGNQAWDRVPGAVCELARGGRRRRPGTG